MEIRVHCKMLFAVYRETMEYGIMLDVTDIMRANKQIDKFEAFP